MILWRKEQREEEKLVTVSPRGRWPQLQEEAPATKAMEVGGGWHSSPPKELSQLPSRIPSRSSKKSMWGRPSKRVGGTKA